MNLKDIIDFMIEKEIYSNSIGTWYRYDVRGLEFSVDNGKTWQRSTRSLDKLMKEDYKLVDTGKK